MSVAESVRGMFGRVSDLMAVSEEPLVQHQFNPSRRFHVFLSAVTNAFCIVGLCFPALGNLAVMAITINGIFFMNRFCSGYKVRPALMYTLFALATFTAGMISCATFYAGVHAANNEEASTAAIVVTILACLTLVPYLFISSFLLHKFANIALLQSAPAMNIVIPPQEQMQEPEAAAAPRSFPVDIAQSDGAAVIQV